MTRQPEEPDKTYEAASMRALGRSVAEIWRGLQEGGMDPEDALEVVTRYLEALASRPPTPE